MRTTEMKRRTPRSKRIYPVMDADGHRSRVELLVKCAGWSSGMHDGILYDAAFLHGLAQELVRSGHIEACRVTHTALHTQIHVNNDPQITVNVTRWYDFAEVFAEAVYRGAMTMATKASQTKGAS